MNVKVTSISVVTCIKGMSFITNQTIYLVAENQRPGNFKMSFIYQMQPQTLTFTYTDDSHRMRSQTNFLNFYGANSRIKCVLPRLVFRQRMKEAIARYGV
jgi:hypothetical protein